MFTNRSISRVFSVLFVLIFILAQAHPAYGAGAWTATGSMTAARFYHTATLLTSGKVLVTGGNNGGIPLASAQIYDPATGFWTVTGSMATARYYHTATLLTNGKVLVTGGINGDYSAEVYDPGTGFWTATGSMSTPRSGHTATLLPNGKVLVTGGFNSASAEVYDPGTGVWTATGSMAGGRYDHTATLLTNGKVLVTGGFGGIPLASAQVYDPATGLWTATTSMTVARYQHTATLLTNGKVLVAGGSGGGIPLASAEEYDPATGLWTATGSIVTARHYHTATRLADGKVLVTGGENSGFLASAEEYDPATGLWTATGSMATVRRLHTATLLTDGTVLVSGGYNGNALASAEFYTVDTTAPETSINTQLSDPDNDSTPSFTFSANDGAGSGIASYMCKMDGDSYAACTSPFTSVALSDGSHTFYVYAIDNAANADASPASYSWTVDTTPPSVASIVRANTNPSNLASVDFTVTFSEPVTGVDTSDFALTTTGVSGEFVIGMSGADATYTVSVGTGSGDGTIRLDVLDDDSILDAASNPLNGGFTGGETYNVDKNDAPTSISLDNSSVAGNLPVGTLVGAFSSTDADTADTFTYSLVSGAGSTDNASFSIAGDQLQTAAVFDSTVKTSYAIRVRTTDNGVGNLSFEQALTITVTANIITPSLLTPVDQEQLIINRPTFDWTDVLGSTNYHLQIYKAISFAKSGKVVDTTATSSTFTPTSDLPAGITLYWRVSRNTASDAGPWSVIRSFTIALPPSVPGPVSPKTNAKNVSLTPLFDWTDSTPSTGTTLLKYELQISTDSAFTSPISVDTINSNHTLTTSLNPNTKYYWRVRACNTLGQCSAWSSVRSFTTVP
jgi:galactose oxidase-like protein